MATVYKFTAGDDALTRLLVNRTLRFTPPNELNDPFECGIDVGTMVEEMQSSIAGRFGNTRGVGSEEHLALAAHIYNHESIKAASRQFGILSLSKTCDELLLWAHYGQSHTGFAVGFDSEHEFFRRSPVIQGEGLQEVAYSERRYVFPGMGKPEYRVKGAEMLEATRGMFWHKSLHWAYEQEIRVLASLLLPETSQLGRPLGVMDFPPEMVTEIVVGVRTPQSLAERIYNLRKELFPRARLRAAWLDPHRFSLNVRDVTDMAFLMAALGLNAMR